MDEQQRTSLIVSSSKRYEYDVFLSFRGEDTRKNFTSYLDKALNKEKIKTFIDDRLEKGDEISTTLIKIIENSRISIVIFSKNYASSKWCLNELSKIMECKRVQEQIVMPVFYDIDPSHVKNQTESYKDAFEKHKEDSRCDQWRNDLTEVANVAGWDSRNSKTEPELLDVIVKTVLKKLVPKYFGKLDGLVGIENSYEEIKSLLKIGSDEVKIFGIWGMGGIGKTTLANAFYEKLSPDFEGRCFLENVREKSEKRQNLCEEIFSKLSGEKKRFFEVSKLRWLLQCKRVFIVLDDVASQEQLEEVIYQFYPLGPGSKVIVTTRNKQIFRLDDVIYSVQELSPHHSLELFCLSAFEEKQPKDGYEDISKEVISYCGGIPLALKVVGACLRSKSKEVWECQLNKLRSIPEMKIQKALRLSYDGLDDSQQSIFLDIACFFKGELRDKMFPISEIEVLLDKSLITIHHNYNGEVIEMHDLIQDMGHEIVRQECIKHHERRSRLWKSKEVVDVLKRNKGNDVVEGIHLNLSTLNESLNLSSNFLIKMTSLRIFRLDNYWSSQDRLHVYHLEVLDSWSDKLEYFHWDGYCFEFLPSKFCAEQLVVLRMQESKLRKLWDGVQNLENLKEIDLRWSKYLTDIPDLSKATKLERVDLYGCESLRQLHLPSLSSKLRYLNLDNCREIKSVNVHSKYLRELWLYGCSSLKEISVSEEITKLYLGGTAINSFSSVSSLPKLTYLDLSNCKEIERLDLHSETLRMLNLDGCLSLKEISVVSEELVALSLCGTTITSISSISSLSKLTYLDLSHCKEIEILDLQSKSLGVLHLQGCSSLTKISITSDELIDLRLNGLSKLESLNVNARSLKDLYLHDRSVLKEISVVSERITILVLSGTTITSFSSISSLPKLTCLDLSDCKEIERIDLHSETLEILKLNGCSSLKEISMVSEEVIELCLSGGPGITSFSSISSLPKLTYLYLSDCKEIERLDLHSKPLKHLVLNGCSSLKEISVVSEEITKLDLSGTAITSLSSSISSLTKLTYLDLSDWKEIERLDLHSKSLKHLVLNGCSSLKEISVVSEEITKLDLSGTAITSLSSSISSLSKLTYLDLSDCKNLESLGELPSSALYGLKAFNCISLETEITQRLVLQHMLQTTIPYLHQSRHRKLWDRDSADEDDVIDYFGFVGDDVIDCFVFPGDHVIDECVFQTRESSISIPCYKLTMTDISGFIYCIVLSQGSLSLSYEMLVSIYPIWNTQDNWGDVYKYHHLISDHDLISDHVVFWYHDYSKFGRMCKVYDHSRDVEIEFKLLGNLEDVKGFGVFPIYVTTSGYKLQISESQFIEQEQPSPSKMRTKTHNFLSITPLVSNSPTPSLKVPFFVLFLFKLVL